MTVEVVPLKPLVSQTLSVRLGDQPCTLHIYEVTTGLFIDVLVNDAAVVSGVAALHGVRIVRDTYLGFVGDLAFIDTQGSDEPEASGLGSRWILVYANP